MLDHFDFLAPFYDRLIKMSLDSAWTDILNLPTDGSILDAGGGTGRISAQFTTLARKVVICDFSLPMLKQARKKELLAVNGSVEKLPFPDGSFERILVIDALHHFKKPQSAINEFARVLKPGGRLVIEDFDISLFAVKLLAWAEKLALMGSRFFTPDQIVEMVDSCGLTAGVKRNGKTSFWIIADK
ncbi:MAG: methyltransferase domain-containing protein [Deltaproteobacteria bacterium]|nr:methyltransferase domain-containing protein [Deltaproteobacteria bacterium]MBT6502609.1 methyltransferase domain-containing protein [Deltaproteobacteria bacterium]MBT7152762.1 methyltransferase domain-containing protein [Deltaproteobacteria bacterium]